MGYGPAAGAKGGRSYIRRAVQASLRRLRTDHIDLYQLHTPDPLTPIEETLAALDELVHDGMVRYVGHSNLSGWQLADAAHVARRAAPRRSSPPRTTGRCSSATWSGAVPAAGTSGWRCCRTSPGERPADRQDPQGIGRSRREAGSTPGRTPSPTTSSTGSRRSPSGPTGPAGRSWRWQSAASRRSRDARRSSPGRPRRSRCGRTPRPGGGSPPARRSPRSTRSCRRHSPAAVRNELGVRRGSSQNSRSSGPPCRAARRSRPPRSGCPGPRRAPGPAA